MAGLLGLATSEASKALSHTVSFAVTLALTTNLAQFTCTPMPVEASLPTTAQPAPEQPGAARSPQMREGGGRNAHAALRLVLPGRAGRATHHG